MRLSDITATTKHPTLEEVWKIRDADKKHPKFHMIYYSETQRRQLEKEMGRVMTREDVQKILHAILNGIIKLR